MPAVDPTDLFRIIYSCAFNFLYDALKVDPRIGLFLPSRVTVVEDKGKVKVMAIDPKRLSNIFNNRQLDEFCTQMHDRYVSLIEDSI
ncbi:MAG: DUF302 domain-containing protein [Gammaproteobacteria bacterium]|nr:DUF302 domain-containing protein [Gammaproteobacteria bacterium]